MNDRNKILIEEQERIQGQVNSWEKELRNMEEKAKGKLDVFSLQLLTNIYTYITFT